MEEMQKNLHKEEKNYLQVEPITRNILAVFSPPPASSRN